MNGQLKVQAYNPDTGAELWSCGGTTYEVIPTPVVGYGMVFCSSGRAGPTLAIRPGGKGDVTRSHLAWTSPRGSPFVPSPILYGEHLYMVNDMQSIVTSFEATTGKVMWQNRLGVARREGFSASPVAVDGKVFFTNDEGETFVLKAGPTFELLRTQPHRRRHARHAGTGGRALVHPDRPQSLRDRTVNQAGLKTGRRAARLRPPTAARNVAASLRLVESPTRYAVGRSTTPSRRRSRPAGSRRTASG